MWKNWIGITGFLDEKSNLACSDVLEPLTWDRTIGDRGMDFNKISPMVSLENVCFFFIDLGAQNDHLLIVVRTVEWQQLRHNDIESRSVNSIKAEKSIA